MSMRYTRLVEDKPVFTDEHHANVHSGFLSLSIIFIVTAAGQRSRMYFAPSFLAGRMIELQRQPNQFELKLTWHRTTSGDMSSVRPLSRMCEETERPA
jgi:hypothetical protein